MRVPAVLYGTADSVALAAAQWTRARLADGDWPGDDADGIDPAGTASAVLLGLPSPGWASELAFHSYRPALEVTQAIVEEDVSPLVEQEAFDHWLTADWSLAGLLASVNVTWLRQSARFRPFLAAAVERWDGLSALGRRYTDGGEAPAPLWSVPTNLKYVLANMGLNPARLRAPLPPGGLAELAIDVADWDGVPVVERWD